MDGHFIVCGLGEVGYRVITLLLRLGEPVTVITQSARRDWARALEDRGVRILAGDARDGALMREAGLADAQALISTTDHDQVNMEVALNAKGERPDLPIVIRLFDQGLAHEFETSLGMRRAVGMSALAAAYFAAAANGDNVLGSFRLDETSMLVGIENVASDSRLEGLRVEEAFPHSEMVILAHQPDSLVPLSPKDVLRDGDRLVLVGPETTWDTMRRREIETVLGKLARLRSALHWFHPGSLIEVGSQVWGNAPASLRNVFLVLLTLIVFSVFVFQVTLDLSLVDAFYFVVVTVTTTGYGDITPRASDDGVKIYTSLFMILGSATIATMYSIITDFVVTSRFRQMLATRLPDSGHIVVAGLGNTGYRIAAELEHMGETTVVIERDQGADLVESARAIAPVVIGDARQSATLQKANANTARVVLAVTGDDATNLAIGLAARKLNPPARIVARLFDADFAEKAQEALNMDVAMSASVMAAPTFVAAALHRHVIEAFVLGDRLIVLTNETVGEDSMRDTAESSPDDRSLLALMRRDPHSGVFQVLSESDPAQHGDRVLALAWHKLLPPR